MSSDSNTHRRTWEDIFWAASRESNPRRLRALAQELDRALEERDRSLGLEHRLNHEQLRARAEEALTESRSTIEELRMSRAEKAKLVRRILAKWAECACFLPKKKPEGQAGGLRRTWDHNRL